MKKIKFLSVLFLLFTAIYFTSCDNEPIDSNINLDDFDPTCSAPSSFQSSDFIDESNVNLSWVAGNDETLWEIQYGIEGFLIGTGTSIITENTNHTITNLNSSNSYQFYVRSLCSETSNSNWVGPILLDAVVEENPTCLNPVSFAALRSTSDDTKVNLTWTTPGDEDYWEIEYGVIGFTLGSGNTSYSSTTNQQISSLIPTTSYDFYIRTSCNNESVFSSWIGPINVPAVSTGGGSTPLFMNANVNGVQYNQMKPFFYNITGVQVGVDYNSNVADGFKLLKIQGNSDPFNTSTNGVEINLYLSQEYWQTGTFVLKSGYDESDLASDYPYVDILVEESGDVIYENEIPGTITILEFNSTTKRIKGTFSFTYMRSDGNGNITGPFNVTNGEFDFPLKDEVFN
jgi:hypothetical protein